MKEFTKSHHKILEQAYSQFEKTTAYHAHSEFSKERCQFAWNMYQSACKEIWEDILDVPYVHTLSGLE